MLFFIINGNKTVFGVTVQLTEEQRKEQYMCRHNFESFSDAQLIASNANDYAERTGKVERYIAIDQGASWSPRYDVIELPRVGEPVSYAFNGDAYPDGHIVSISKSLKVIETSTGNRYYRRKLTGSWIRSGTWSMIHGHHNERNPSF